MLPLLIALTEQLFSVLQEKSVTNDRKHQEQENKVDFWTLDEFQKVISCSTRAIITNITFSSHTDSCLWPEWIGEAAALQWSDINFETGLLSITKTLYYKTMDEYKFVEPKTQASIRTIYIDMRYH